MSLLSIQSISYRFENKHLFSNLSLEVHSKDFWVITGPSGVGKSTLLKILTGEMQAQSGKIERTGILGEMPQGLSLTPNLTALENIAVGDLKNLHWTKSFLKIPHSSLQKAQEFSRPFQIQETLHQKIESLSGGERQRVALARSLMQKPDLLILDEPVSMLDPKLADLVLNELKNRSAICVLHQMELVEKYATHILNLDPKHPEGWKVLK